MSTSDAKANPLGEVPGRRTSSQSVAPDLSRVLFEEEETGEVATSPVRVVEPPPPATSSPSSDPAAPKNGSLKLQSFQAWPKSVPSKDKALRMLRGQDDDGATATLTRALLDGLSGAELSALQVSDVEAGPLQEAVVVRWRLAVALDRKPLLGAPFDESALEKMMGEVDHVLDNLPSAEGADSELQAGLTSVRGALARDAIALSEFSRKSREAAVKEARAIGRTAAPQSVRQVTVQDDQQQGTDRRKTVLIVFTAILALASGVYNGLRLRNEAPVSPMVEKTLPPNTLGSVDHRSGVTLFAPMDPQKFDAAALQQLRTKSEAQGLLVKDMGNGRYLIGPAELLKNASNEPKR